jgi:exopolysaccharide biosynthesis WecB/TagA/CpsF family protein/anti-anti-sigma factor
MNNPPNFRPVVLLGVPFHDVTLEETVQEIARVITQREIRYLATANLDFAAQASRDVELQRILVEAHLVLCDGTPLVWASRWLGAPLRERIAGSDLVPRLAAEAATRGWRLFFLGGEEETRQRAQTRLQAKHPGLAVEGYSPPFGPLLEMNHEEIATRIRAFRPDILLVAFGCPKQEKWIYMHHATLGVPVVCGIGATVDFLAGKFRRAPRWVQVIGAEWVFRLLQEPRRLFQRYLFDLFFFVQALRAQRRSVQSLSPRPLEAVAPTPLDRRRVELHRWTGRVDAAAVQSGAVRPPVGELPGSILALDLSQVTFMDSTGLGALLSGFRGAVRRGGGLALVRPAPAVQRLLAAVKLDRLLTVVDDPSDAPRALGFARPATAPAGPAEMVLPLQGDLTAASVPGHWRWLEERWEADRSTRQLVLDLSGVRFIDSSGLGFFLRARLLARSRDGGALVLRGAGENVRNVLRLARVETILPCEEAGAPSPPKA